MPDILAAGLIECYVGFADGEEISRGALIWLAGGHGEWRWEG